MELITFTKGLWGPITLQVHEEAEELSNFNLPVQIVDYIASHIGFRYDKELQALTNWQTFKDKPTLFVLRAIFGEGEVKPNEWKDVPSNVRLSRGESDPVRTDPTCDCGALGRKDFRTLYSKYIRLRAAKCDTCNKIYVRTPPARLEMRWLTLPS